jgi:hypothetical protein
MLINDRYVLLSVAAVSILILICAVGSFNTEGTDGNGFSEITGMISDPAGTPNGTVFRITDLEGNEIKCFSSLPVPETPALCRIIGNYSSDGNIFFVDVFVTTER